MRCGFDDEPRSGKNRSRTRAERCFRYRAGPAAGRRQGRRSQAAGVRGLRAPRPAAPADRRLEIHRPARADARGVASGGCAGCGCVGAGRSRACRACDGRRHPVGAGEWRLFARTVRCGRPRRRRSRPGSARRAGGCRQRGPRRSAQHQCQRQRDDLAECGDDDRRRADHRCRTGRRKQADPDRACRDALGRGGLYPLVPQGRQGRPRYAGRKFSGADGAKSYQVNDAVIVWIGEGARTGACPANGRRTAMRPTFPPPFSRSARMPVSIPSI